MATIAGAVTTVVHSSQHANKRAMHTSILTGQRWLDELLTGSQFRSIFLDILSDLCVSQCIGHPSRFRRQFGMQRFVFRKLLRELEHKCGLHNTKHVTSEEQLAIFLRIARTGMGNQEMQERFQRSGDTISK
jgi:hypothetical protein